MHIYSFSYNNIFFPFNSQKTHCSSDNSNVEIVEFNQTEIDYILQLHNDYRNAVANGSMERYDSASMMVKMVSNRYDPIQSNSPITGPSKVFNKIVTIFILQVWNDELAKLAGLNTRNCSFGHDSCRNTGKCRIVQIWLLQINSFYE